jgi:hypothetical protein
MFANVRLVSGHELRRYESALFVESGLPGDEHQVSGNDGTGV